jgi:hypothetical protein
MVMRDVAADSFQRYVVGALSKLEDVVGQLDHNTTAWTAGEAGVSTGPQFARRRGRPEVFDSASMTVTGDEDAIVEFNKRLLNNVSEVETIDRDSTEMILNGAKLIVGFHPAVTADYAIRRSEETATAAGVNADEFYFPAW